MGTNYYLYPKEQPKTACPACGHFFQPSGDYIRETGPLHIGKSSAGWCFSLRVYPQDECPETWLGLKEPENLKEWEGLWSRDDVIIKSEYGEIVAPERMLSFITDRHGRIEDMNGPPYGYESWRDFYKANSAQPGPSGLLRHKIGVGHCIAHGDGTYDLIAGEFS